MSTKSKKARSRQADFVRALLLVIAAPAFFVVLAFIQQGRLTAGASASWWAPALTFVVGAAITALPRSFPIVSLPVVAIGSVFLSWVTAFNGFTFMCFAVAGFALGLGLRSLIFQIRNHPH